MIAARHWEQGKQAKHCSKRTLSDFLQLLIILHCGGWLKNPGIKGGPGKRLDGIGLERENPQDDDKERVFAFCPCSSSSSAVAVHTTNGGVGGGKGKKNTFVSVTGARGQQLAVLARGETQTRSDSRHWTGQRASWRWPDIRETNGSCLLGQLVSSSHMGSSRRGSSTADVGQALGV